MDKEMKRLLYAQSGGVTSVINTTAQAVVEASKINKHKIKGVLCAKHGVVGVLKEDIYDLSTTPLSKVKTIGYNPGGVFGSCRFKLKSNNQNNQNNFERLIKVLDAHDVGYFLYNGGGDSADTSNKISNYAKKVGYDLTVIHIPKTIDNDLPYTDFSPGFPSVAKYVAVSTQETSLDLASMYVGSTKVFILEVMGRHAGWIAASGGLAETEQLKVPTIILFPEIKFDKDAFLKKVRQMVTKNGYVSVIVSEGLKDKNSKLLNTQSETDAFGHKKLGGVGNYISQLIGNNLKLKSHLACADYLQRSARHLASKVDLEQAAKVGRYAVELAIKNINGVMVTIERNKAKTIKFTQSYTKLSNVANRERFMPRNFINAEGYGITKRCKNYLSPLIYGESSPVFVKGLAKYRTFSFPKVVKKLPRLEGYKILIVAPPGAGKGTQTNLISQKLKIKSITCSDLLRAEVKTGSQLGQELKSYMSEGNLVPDELIISIMNKELQKNMYNSGFLLDGFPRTTPQAQALHDSSITFDLVFELRIPKSIIIERISGRYIHPASGRSYHIKFNPPKKPGIDDITGEPLIQRSDDTIETISNRMMVYEKETKPLIKFYKKLASQVETTHFYSINGNQAITKVSKNILDCIKTI